MIPPGAHRTPLSRSFVSLAAALGLVVLTTSVRADTTWSNTSTNFNDAGSWSAGLPDTADQAIMPNSAATFQPTLTGDISIGGLRFGTTAGYILDGAFTLNLGYTGNTSGTAALAAGHTSGTQTVEANTILNFNAGTSETPASQYIMQTGSGGTMSLKGLITASVGTTLNFSVSGSTSVINISGTSNSWATDTNIFGTGIVAVASIGSAGGNSSLGAGNNINLGTTTSAGNLRYTGSGETAGKKIYLLGNAVGGSIESSGTGALIIAASGFEMTGSGSKTFTLGGSYSTTANEFQALIQDSGGTTTFTKSGTSLWLLSNNNNSYSGPTNVTAGTLVVTSIGSAGSNSSVGAGSTINLGSTSNSGGLRYTGTGETTGKTINLNGTTGGGTLSHSGTNAWNVNAMTFNGAGIKTLTLTGDSTGIATINADIVNNSASNFTAVSKTGEGTWILAGNNSYGGVDGSNNIYGTTITAGMLGVSNNGALGVQRLQFNQNGTGILFATQDVTLANNISIERLSTGNGSNSARFAGDYSITLDGNITSGANTQSSGVTNRGIVNNIAEGKFLTINGFFQTSHSNTSSGHSLSISGSGNTIFNGEIRNSSAGTPTAMSLNYTGTGSLTMAGVNLYTGSTNFSGTGKVNLNNAAALGGTSGVTFGGSSIDNTSGGAITYNNSPTVNISTDTTFFNTSATVGQSSSNMTFGGNVTMDGSRVITLNNRTGGPNTTLTFNGILNGYNGTRTITVSGDNNTLVLGGVNISTASNNSRHTIFAGDGDVIITGSVAQGGGTNNALSYSGTGVLILDGETNSYNGATTINSGKMVINGEIVSATTVNLGGTLGGRGKLTTISGAGTVSVGNSAGIMTATSINVSTGMDFDFEFTQLGAPTWNNAAASGNDVLHLTLNATPITGGAMDSDNVFNLYFAAEGTYQGGIYSDFTTTSFESLVANAEFNYYVLDAGGSIVFNGLNYTQVSGGLMEVVQVNSSFGASPDPDGVGYIMQFTAPAVPEPSGTVALLVSLGAMTFLRRRRAGAR